MGAGVGVVPRSEKKSKTIFFRIVSGNFELFLGQVAENSPKLCKNKPFFAYETLVVLKNRPKSTFQPMKVCSKWVFLEVS